MCKIHVHFVTDVTVLVSKANDKDIGKKNSTTTTTKNQNKTKNQTETTTPTKPKSKQKTPHQIKVFNFELWII